MNKPYEIASRALLMLYFYDITFTLIVNSERTQINLVVKHFAYYSI